MEPVRQKRNLSPGSKQGGNKHLRTLEGVVVKDDPVPSAEDCFAAQSEEAQRYIRHSVVSIGDELSSQGNSNNGLVRGPGGSPPPLLALGVAGASLGDPHMAALTSQSVADASVIFRASEPSGLGVQTAVPEEVAMPGTGAGPRVVQGDGDRDGVAHGSGVAKSAGELQEGDGSSDHSEVVDDEEEEEDEGDHEEGHEGEEDADVGPGQGNSHSGEAGGNAATPNSMQRRYLRWDSQESNQLALILARAIQASEVLQATHGNVRACWAKALAHFNNAIALHFPHTPSCARHQTIKEHWTKQLARFRMSPHSIYPPGEYELLMSELSSLEMASRNRAARGLIKASSDGLNAGLPTMDPTLCSSPPMASLSSSMLIQSHALAGQHPGLATPPLTGVFSARRLPFSPPGSYSAAFVTAAPQGAGNPPGSVSASLTGSGLSASTSPIPASPPNSPSSSILPSSSSSPSLSASSSSSPTTSSGSSSSTSSSSSSGSSSSSSSEGPSPGSSSSSLSSSPSPPGSSSTSASASSSSPSSSSSSGGLPPPGSASANSIATGSASVQGSIQNIAATNGVTSGSGVVGASAAVVGSSFMLAHPGNSPLLAPHLGLAPQALAATQMMSYEQMLLETAKYRYQAEQTRLQREQAKRDHKTRLLQQQLELDKEMLELQKEKLDLERQRMCTIDQRAAEITQALLELARAISETRRQE